MTAAVTCANCGAKVRAGRARCPRCRAVLTLPNPARAAASSRRLTRAAAIVVGLFALLVAALWMLRDPAPAPHIAGPVSDPFATRRAASPDAPEPTRTAEASPEAAPNRPFLDAAGAGTTAYAEGNYGTALAQYQAAVEKNPQDAESLSNLGQVLVRLNRTAESIPHFERAVEILPGRWAYHFNLARALGLVGRTDDAIAGYRRAQQLFPDDYATAFNLAMTLHQKGDEAAAVEQYEKAIALQPDDASFRKALGISYEQMRKHAEASAAYQDYLRLSPSAADADAVRARIARLTQAPPAPGAAAAGDAKAGAGDLQR